MGIVPQVQGWVLGASGFLGAQIARTATAQGHAIVGLCRSPLEALGWPCSWRQVDLSRPGQLRAAMEQEAPAWILNCAAMARPADCERDPELAQRLNGDLPGEAAGCAAALGIRFLHVSTDLVFEGSAEQAGGYREEHEARPYSQYAKSKRAGELAALAANPATLVVRLSLLYGDSHGRGLGASDSLLAAIARGQRPGLFTDEWRTPLDVADGARGLLELLAGNERGLLHLGGPGRLTRHELGLETLKASGLSADRITPALQKDFKSVPARPRDVSLDSSRAHSFLSFSPRFPGEALANSQQGRPLP